LTEGDKEMKTLLAPANAGDVLDSRLCENNNPTNTVFDLFEEDYTVKLVTIKLQCPACRHTWGVKLEDYDEYHQIPDRKFICQECSHHR
jgi:hypothetical protein